MKLAARRRKHRRALSPIVIRQPGIHYFENKRVLGTLITTLDPRTQRMTYRWEPNETDPH